MHQNAGFMKAESLDAFSFLKLFLKQQLLKLAFARLHMKKQI